MDFELELLAPLSPLDLDISMKEINETPKPQPIQTPTQLSRRKLQPVSSSQRPIQTPPPISHYSSPNLSSTEPDLDFEALEKYAWPTFEEDLLVDAFITENADLETVLSHFN